MFFDVIREAGNLFVAILRRDGYQDRLVKSTSHQFHLAALHQGPQFSEVLRMSSFDPLQQRTGEMQSHANPRMARQDFHERRIRLRVGAFHYIVKVSDGLMRMNEEN